VRAGGIPHIVDDGRNGVLVAPGDAAALAAAIHALVADSQRRQVLARQGRCDSERWSWRASTVALLGYYRAARRVRRRARAAGAAAQAA